MLIVRPARRVRSVEVDHHAAQAVCAARLGIRVDRFCFRAVIAHDISIIFAVEIAVNGKLPNAAPRAAALHAFFKREYGIRVAVLSVVVKFKPDRGRNGRPHPERRRSRRVQRAVFEVLRVRRFVLFDKLRAVEQRDIQNGQFGLYAVHRQF